MSYVQIVMEIMKWMSEKCSILSFLFFFPVIVTWLGYFKRSIGFGAC